MAKEVDLGKRLECIILFGLLGAILILAQTVFANSTWMHEAGKFLLLLAVIIIVATILKCSEECTCPQCLMQKFEQGGYK